MSPENPERAVQAAADTKSKQLMNKQYMAIGVSLGLCFGVALGAAMHNMGFIGIGLPLGVAIGVALARKKSEDET